MNMLISHCRNGAMVELADTPVLGTGVARREGSSPFCPTKKASEVTMLETNLLHEMLHLIKNVAVSLRKVKWVWFIQDWLVLGTSGATLKSSSLLLPTIINKRIMKITIENIKGLKKDIRIFIDRETMNSHMDEKYEEIKNTVNLKGFRPGKVPKEVLKRQFGKALFGEVLDKVLKDTSTKALEESKIKPA